MPSWPNPKARRNCARIEGERKDALRQAKQRQVTGGRLGAWEDACACGECPPILNPAIPPPPLPGACVCIAMKRGNPPMTMEESRDPIRPPAPCHLINYNNCTVLGP
eukprot:2112975-Rhodomonas_salina.2